MVGGFGRNDDGNIPVGSEESAKACSTAGGLVSERWPGGGVASGLWKAPADSASGILSAGKGILGAQVTSSGGLGRRAGIPKGIDNPRCQTSSHRVVMPGTTNSGNGVANGLLSAAVGGTSAPKRSADRRRHRPRAMEACPALAEASAPRGMASDGGGSIMHGASQILHGSPLAGLRFDRQGIVGGTGSVLKGGADAVGSVASGAGMPPKGRPRRLGCRQVGGRWHWHRWQRHRVGRWSRRAGNGMAPRTSVAQSQAEPKKLFSGWCQPFQLSSERCTIIWRKSWTMAPTDPGTLDRSLGRSLPRSLLRTHPQGVSLMAIDPNAIGNFPDLVKLLERMASRTRRISPSRRFKSRRSAAN